MPGQTRGELERDAQMVRSLHTIATNLGRIADGLEHLCQLLTNPPTPTTPPTPTPTKTGTT